MASDITVKFPQPSCTRVTEDHPKEIFRDYAFENESDLLHRLQVQLSDSADGL